MELTIKCPDCGRTLNWVDCSYGFPMNPSPLYWMPLPDVPDLPDYNAVDEEENVVDFKDLFEKIWEDHEE